MTHHFCTYFDRGYVSRALVLHDSLVATGLDFQLTALCLDADALAAIQARIRPTLRAVSLDELEAYDPSLTTVKPERSTYEYYFTLGPSLLTMVLDGEEVDRVTYLDADLCFYSTPEPLFDESAGAATTIVGHRFPARLQHLEETGRFNLAWVGFTDDPDGRACLAWWREQCLAWCFDRVEPTRYADQKYLDEFSARFPRVHELAHPGADVAPWNLADPPLERQGGTFVVGGRPLVFFHFQGFRQSSPHLIDPNLRVYGNRATAPVRTLYRDYVWALRRVDGPAAASPRRSALEANKGVRTWVSRLRGILRRDLVTDLVRRT